jgi:hypothetical protein
MELGQYHLQIFVSLVVLLGAASVALLCDYLRSHNEQLRELTIELRVRREEEKHLSRMMMTPAMAAEPSLQQPAAVRERTRMERAEQQRMEQRLEVPARGLAGPAPREARDSGRERKRPPSPGALAAMERGARLAASLSKPPEVVKIEDAPVVVDAPVAAIPSALVPRDGGGVKKDWESLLARKSSNPVPQEAPAQVEMNPNAVPAGFHENYVLSRLVQSRQPVSGLIVSIGVNTPRNPDGSMPEQVRKLMESLLKPGDFACQSSSEEFLLIFPNEQGAPAQRRLSEISQHLWDFQIRSMGSFSILFSWGGVEVRSESIDEAVASANERMQETRRGRKLLSMEPRHEALPQAV